MNNNTLPLVTYEQAQWKNIADYDGLYQVSSDGQVKRMPGTKFNKLTGRYNRSEQILSNCPNSQGYIGVGLSNGNVRKSFKVHRLVAEAFIPNPQNLPEVNHKNCVKSDNRVENLEWVSRSQNIQHAFDNGLNRPNKVNLGKPPGEHTSARAIQEIDIDGNVIKEFTSIVEATTLYGLPQGEVSRVCSGKHKSVHGKYFRYA